MDAQVEETIQVRYLLIHEVSNRLFPRNTRKKLSKKPLVREQVKTVSKYDLQKSEKRKEMIAGSKRRTKRLY